jgi:hypothetical protein
MTIYTIVPEKIHNVAAETVLQIVLDGEVKQFFMDEVWNWGTLAINVPPGGTPPKVKEDPYKHPLIFSDQQQIEYELTDITSLTWRDGDLTFAERLEIERAYELNDWEGLEELGVTIVDSRLFFFGPCEITSNDATEETTSDRELPE